MAEHTSPPRIRLPRGWSRQVKSAVLHVVAGQLGSRFALPVDFHSGARHLPIVSLKRVAWTVGNK